MWKFKKRRNVDRERIKNDPEYQKISELIEKFDYSNVNKIEWILDYAQRYFESMKETVDYLDEKANILIRYLGLGVGVIGLILGSDWLQFTALTKVIALGGITAWAFSIVIALNTRKPAEMTYPPPVERLFDYMKQHKNIEAAQAELSLNYQKVAVGLRIVGLNKANKLIWAYRLLVIALTLFLISIFFVLFPFF